jgi:malate dehydrogenase (oxaloacetate-decarboxylating)
VIAGVLVFALSNPDPEIHPAVAARHASIVAAGRNDFPNQVNNVLAFPGVFRGALDAGTRRITESAKLTAADAIHSVANEDLAADRIPRARSTRGSRRRWRRRWRRPPGRILRAVTSR